MFLLPNSLSFRFVATIQRRPGASIPLGFTGRVRFVDEGRLDEVAWFVDGQLDDPSPQSPAVLRYRPNGATKQVRHYRLGRLHDPMPGSPAVVGSFADGSVKYREHYRYGRRHDSGDIPAITKWRNDGSVRTRHHYYEGIRIERFLSAG